MRIVGLALILATAPTLSRELTARSSARLECVNDICAFLEFAEREVRLSLTPLPRIVSAFLEAREVSGEVAGILSQADGGALTKRELLSKEDSERLRAFILGSGRDIGSGVLGRIAETRAYFSARQREELERDRKERKVYPLLVLGGGAGLFLLMI